MGQSVLGGCTGIATGGGRRTRCVSWGCRWDRCRLQQRCHRRPRGRGSRCGPSPSWPRGLCKHVCVCVCVCVWVGGWVGGCGWVGGWVGGCVCVCACVLFLFCENQRTGRVCTMPHHERLGNGGTHAAARVQGTPATVTTNGTPPDSPSAPGRPAGCICACGSSCVRSRQQRAVD
jgi:hypothetical protein